MVGEPEAGPRGERVVPIAAAKCAFSEADMRRAHALERAARALCREARSSERVSESDCLEIGMFGR